MNLEPLDSHYEMDDPHMQYFHCGTFGIPVQTDLFDQYPAVPELVASNCVPSILYLWYLAVYPPNKHVHTRMYSIYILIIIYNIIYIYVCDYVCVYTRSHILCIVIHVFKTMQCG